ncbi:MAG TPA: hypothetical protein VMT62_15705 [Syntrophorhabdaceae bacterium]|nr:hypothetical protein [Syntrophorhabdaceae bacterium]
MKKMGRGVIGAFALTMIAFWLLAAGGCASMDENSEPSNQSYHKGYPYAGCDGRPVWWCFNGPPSGY